MKLKPNCNAKRLFFFSIIVFKERGKHSPIYFDNKTDPKQQLRVEVISE